MADHGLFDHQLTNPSLIDDSFGSSNVKEESVEPPLSQNTMNALTNELEFENLDNLVVLSQGSSQKSIGDVQARLTVGTFEQEKIVKATPWIYSQTLQRLFLKNAVKVPLRFSCEGTFSTHMRIVVFLRYQEVQHQGEPVEVCPNHLRQNEYQNLDHPRHVLQYTGERFATYSEPPEMADFGIRIPLLQEAFSQSGQTESFSFVCLSSCMMIGRKKTLLCAELHYRDQILSKVDVPLKISVCPMRDMQNEEGKCVSNVITTQGSNLQEKPPLKRARKPNNAVAGNDSASPVSELIVRVKGRKFIEDLKTFLATKIPSQHYALYSQHVSYN
ncbi:hypothetical protein BIW11_06069 [Tropilaelaps mercedesae]|uniref:p53 DNA-binding domain-containing protein n=1 Tax=Tropilaelaps mercedesae TaxID=418985 RepID=A0A1V9XZQ4_9ACAR|nr:hypothetical protein BIW11_06069 [Tropilaelaps mercedesae]